MAYDELLADRLRESLKMRVTSYEEKKMMGGLCFMVDDKMCIGIVKDQLMARVDPEEEDDLLQKEGSKPMDFTGRPMRGYLFIDPLGVDMDEDLDFWVEKCLDFNPKAKSSKKK